VRLLAPHLAGIGTGDTQLAAPLWSTCLTVPRKRRTGVCQTRLMPCSCASGTHVTARDPIGEAAVRPSDSASIKPSATTVTLLIHTHIFSTELIVQIGGVTVVVTRRETWESRSIVYGRRDATR